MKTGEVYWCSKEKRAFDLIIAGPMQPVLSLARLAVRSSSDGVISPDTLFRQKRVGKGEGVSRIFEIEKIQTLGPDELPLNRLAQRFRKLGIDELAQLTNIRRGEMAICGYRPLVPIAESPGQISYEEVMDHLAPELKEKWSRMTQGRQPGILSSYGLYDHTKAGADPNQFDIRAELDLRDAQEDSLRSNIGFLRQFADLALARRFQ